MHRNYHSFKSIHNGTFYRVFNDDRRGSPIYSSIINPENLGQMIIGIKYTDFKV